MTTTGSNIAGRVGEYYDFIESLGDSVDPIQAAMFIELEFDIVIPDAQTTEEHLGRRESAAKLVQQLKSVPAQSI
jgi:acyl carrier protein